MSIFFDPSWSTVSLDHLKTEYVAKRILESAAIALETDPIHHKNFEVRIWCSAALCSAGAAELRLSKGLHFESDTAIEPHLTMHLRTPGSEQGAQTKHTVFEGAFHLYCQISKPTKESPAARIRPVRLTYRLVPNTLEGNLLMERSRKKADIVNARSVISELKI